jgi:hypothetical protein
MDPSADGRRLRTRESDLVAETLSDETLVIDTASGVFFSLRGVASVLWAMLQHPTSEGALRAAVRDHFTFTGPGDVDVDEDVDSFVSALLADGLVVETDDGTTADPVPVTWPETYEPPVLKKYDDMADLLLVDPIHDVAADQGWPNKARDGS